MVTNGFVLNIRWKQTATHFEILRTYGQRWTRFAVLTVEYSKSSSTSNFVVMSLRKPIDQDKSVTLVEEIKNEKENSLALVPIEKYKKSHQGSVLRSSKNMDSLYYPIRAHSIQLDGWYAVSSLRTAALSTKEFLYFNRNGEGPTRMGSISKTAKILCVKWLFRLSHWAGNAKNKFVLLLPIVPLLTIDLYCLRRRPWSEWKCFRKQYSKPDEVFLLGKLLVLHLSCLLGQQ